MDNVISALDEYFCAHYSDYVRLSALEGYVMPDVVYVAEDGNIARRDPSCMRLCHQKDPAALLARLKEGLADTNFTFSFAFPPLRGRSRLHAKGSFSRILPEILHHTGETTESAGEKLSVEPRFWTGMVKGKLLPEMNTVIALILVCRMSARDASALFAACGYGLHEDNVRDVVVRYLIEQKIFGDAMRDKCLSEYRIENLPIRRNGEAK